MNQKELADASRLLFTITWNGPWERLMAFFLGVRRDSTLRWEVKEDTVLSRLAIWAEKKDLAWRRWHLARGTVPRAIWKRRRVTEKQE